MADKKTRLTFTTDEWSEIYAALGARSGMLRDGAAIRNLRPSEYSLQVLAITSIQDRIYNAINDGGTEETTAAPASSITPAAPAPTPVPAQGG